MGNSKPMASLSSGLLARKGQAKPAMRPQGFVGLSPNASYDDLGWNDMGDEPVAVTQPVHNQPAGKAPEKPVVLRQIEAIAEQISQPVPPAPTPAPAAKPLAPAAAVRVAREAAAKGNKAAFTLRLDTDRHLRLRLASAVTNRSAQQIVTEALDAFLNSQPEVEALARQIGPGKDHG
ncbi:MAG: hypothetical protein KF730_11090 [Sphingomonas sp.]|uniref:hypothetical protein n=1 Tax=Sphingomonas sp. TaxID=28214 RepID=UPI0025FF804D|nr:hypothetical protein [Sphingomonas sp.]MBX3565105.1 hypothetical protein [Sphingomonas sp.]